MRTIFFNVSDCTKDKDCSLRPPVFLYRYGVEDPDYRPESRRYQAIPAVCRTRGGRLWGACYSGGTDEGPNNYIPLFISDDDGLTWRDNFIILDHPDAVRMHEPVLWLDPDGKMWLFWNQSYITWDGRGGVWASRCLNPDADRPVFENPRRLCDGVLANKPCVNKSGEWLFPICVWKDGRVGILNPAPNHLPALQRTAVYVSHDKGETLEYRGAADIPETSFDEHSIVVCSDDSLLLLARTGRRNPSETANGIAESRSYDGGRTWTPSHNFVIPGPDSRFAAYQLNSGNLVLITHDSADSRSRMSAFLSRDDGVTWDEKLLLDERNGVSYPDVCESENGDIYAIYDHERYREHEILLAKFTEKDIAASNFISEDSYSKKLAAYGERRAF